MLEDKSEKDDSTWPPSPVTHQGEGTSKINKYTTSVCQKNIAWGAIAGAAVNFVLNFFFMIAGDILWLDVEKKLNPKFQPAHSYFGTGTSSFLWIMLVLSLISSLCVLIAKSLLPSKVKIAYIAGACLTSTLTIAFWLSVENINML